MKKFSDHRLALLAIVVVFGYLLIRLVLEQEGEPVIFELFAAIIGFTLTILATSVLLNKQTEAELTKEENIQFLNLKMNMYQELLNQLQDIILKKRISREDVVELRLLNQRISFIGSPEVLIAFNQFVRFFATLSKREKITNLMIDQLLDEMSKLTVYIRNDLFQTDTRVLSIQEIKDLILSSNDLLDVEE